MNNREFKEQLIKRAFDFARKIIALVNKFPQKPSARIISNQLLRSASSIGANIIEAQAASSKRDFANFLNHSLKSGNETKYWLALARDFDVRFVPEINKLIKEADELVKILGSVIATMRGKRKSFI